MEQECILGLVSTDFSFFAAMMGRGHFPLPTGAAHPAVLTRHDLWPSVKEEAFARTCRPKHSASLAISG